MSKLWKWIDSNKILALLLIVWVIGLITPVTLYLFIGLATEFNASVASAYAALLGIPTAVFGFVKWRLSKHDDGGGGGG